MLPSIHEETPLKRPHFLVALFLAASLQASPCSANFRPVRHWTYPELMNEADLVIIGVPAWTEVARNVPLNPRHERQLRTSIDVRLTIKGVRRLGPIDLTYFEYAPRELGPGLAEARPGNSAQYLELTTTAQLERNARPGEQPPTPSTSSSSSSAPTAPTSPSPATATPSSPSNASSRSRTTGPRRPAPTMSDQQWLSLYPRL